MPFSQNGLPLSSSLVLFCDRIFSLQCPIYSPHHPTFPASFSLFCNISTSLLSSSPTSLFPYISFSLPFSLPASSSSSHLAPTAAPGADLLAATFAYSLFLEQPPNFYLLSSHHAGHHVSASCSRLGLASSLISLPLSTSI